MKTMKPSAISGEISIPASKSQTIRALLIAAFSKEKSVIRNPLVSSDTLSCVNAIRALGASVEFNEDSSVCYVDASALECSKDVTIDAGNSGTTEYLLLGLAASLGGRITITGDEQLRSRPAGPLAKALEDLGAEVKADCGKPPVSIKGPLRGGSTVIECKTSQYLSSLLLASPLASSDCRIDCSLLYEKPYVELTLGWLREQGIEFTISDDLEHASVKGGQRYRGFDKLITGDFSSASFFAAAAAITGCTLTISGLDRYDKQGDKAILDILQAMGAGIEWKSGSSVTVKGPERLKGGEFDLNAIPDTLPILAVTGAFAHGDVHLTNAPQARIKETDRIRTMVENLRALGADVEEEEDGMLIHGKGRLDGGEAKGFGDHRIIMALAIGALKAEKGITIDDTDAVSVTFPTFFSLYDRIKA